MRANSYISSIMNITADIMIQQNTQNENTGVIAREWLYQKTIQCKIEPIKSRGASINGDNKVFTPGNNSTAGYDEGLMIKMKTLQLLSKRWRINNIRSSNGKQVFVEIDKYGDPDTIFEVMSSHAVMDPFGKVSYYEATLKRVPTQNNDKNIN